MVTDGDAAGRRARKAAWQALTGGLPAVLTSHVRVDGDAVGSVLALWHGLRAAGVGAYVFLEGPVSEMFDFLPGIDERSRSLDGVPETCNVVVVDCGSYGRIGSAAEALLRRGPVINIDHHDGNTMFGDVNYVDPAASSCGEMVYAMLKDAGVPLDRATAECIFAAVLTDTGQFSHQDTTAEAFSVCAACVRAGVDPYKMARRLFLSPSPDQVKLRHLALGTLRLHHGGQIATMEVTEEMFRQTGLGPPDTEGLAEVAISIRGVRAAALLKEMPGAGFVKVSMRSHDDMDVRAVADAFGGGGHRNAAGCEIKGLLEDVREAVVRELSRRLVSTAS